MANKLDTVSDATSGSHSGSRIRNPQSTIRNFDEVNYDELLEPIRFRFALDRRSFVQLVGGGVLITAIGTPVFAQRRSGRGRGMSSPPAPLSARVHITDDGTITVFSGKV